MSFDFRRIFANLVHGEATGTDLSRRHLLGGLGMIGALAVAGPTLLASGEAEADDFEAEVMDASYHGDRGPGRSPGRGRRRRRRGTRRPRQRFTHRQLVHRCRNERRFRRRNPNLCHQALAMGRRSPGACVRLGDFEVCF